MSQPTSPSSNQEQNLLDSVRSILRGEDSDRLNNLEQELSAIEHAHLAQKEDLLRQIADLEKRLEAEHNGLEGQLSSLRQEVESVSNLVVPSVTNSYPNIVRQAITQSQDNVAAAHAPIIGPAIRQQIRDSRDDMVEALYPIIFEAVSRAISEFRREIQRNIDARYESTFGAGSVFRRIYARSRGISAADLAIRDALSFEIEQVFLIERETGLLVSHYAAGVEESEDSDLIGGMLTAIRDFVSDSFTENGQPEELNEIQYGANSVIIQTGQLVYAAAVIDGNEPAGFRGELRNLVSKIHLNHEDNLRDYEGDPSTVAHLKDDLIEFSQNIGVVNKPEAKPLSKGQRWVIFLLFMGLLLASSCACFQLWINAQFLGLTPNLIGERSANMVTLDSEAHSLRPNSDGLESMTALFVTGSWVATPNVTANKIQFISTARESIFAQPAITNQYNLNSALTANPIVQLNESGSDTFHLALPIESAELTKGWTSFYGFTRSSLDNVQN